MADYVGIVDNIMYSLSGADPSSSGRIGVINEAWSFFKSNPLGAGLGTVGVVVRRFIPDAPQFEGELFNILAMMGPLAIALHLYLLSKIYRKFKNRFSKGIYKSAFEFNFSNMIIMILIAITCRELILPRDFTNYSLGWFLVGAGLTYKDKLWKAK